MTWSIEVRFNQTTHRSLCCVLMLEGYDSCQILVNHTAAGSLRDGFTLQCSLCIQRGAVYYGERGCISVRCACGWGCAVLVAQTV